MQTAKLSSKNFAFLSWKAKAYEGGRGIGNKSTVIKFQEVHLANIANLLTKGHAGM